MFPICLVASPAGRPESRVLPLPLSILALSVALLGGAACSPSSEGPSAEGSPAPEAVPTESASAAQTRSDTATPSEEPTSAEEKRVDAWNCTDGTFVVSEYRPDSDTVWLFLPGESVELEHVRAASGARYGNETITFWSRENEATLVRDGETVTCTRDARRSQIEAAKLAGFDFWGTGNEPGWTLRLGPEEIVWTTDYGQTRHRVAAPEPVSEEDATTWSTTLEGEPFAVSLSLGPCQDDMSGEEFETAVVIRHGERTYRGCGQPLH